MTIRCGCGKGRTYMKYSFDMCAFVCPVCGRWSNFASDEGLCSAMVSKEADEKEPMMQPD